MNPPEKARVLWVHVVDRNGHYISGATLLYFADGILAQSINLSNRPCYFEINPPDTEVKFAAIYEGRRREEVPPSDSSDCRIELEDVIIETVPTDNLHDVRTSTQQTHVG